MLMETYHNMSFKSLDIIHARSNIIIADYVMEKQKEDKWTQNSHLF